LQGPEGAQAGDQQQRAGHLADRRDLFGEVVFAGGVDGQVQAEAERCSPLYRAMMPCSGPLRPGRSSTAQAAARLIAAATLAELAAPDVVVIGGSLYPDDLIATRLG
jgi:hypothetical protein